MRTVALLTPAIVAALGACGAGDADPAAIDADPGAIDAPAPDAAGSAGCGLAAPTGARDGTIVAAGLTRTYLLVVPGAYDPARPYPLIFAWHGRTGTAAGARQYFGIEAAAAGDAIVVYPQGLPVSGDPNDTGWELRADGRDVALFDALLAELEATYCVGRVYSMGHSFGGYMSNTLACHRGGDAPRAVRAIGPVAGGGPVGACPGEPVSAIVIHGTLDQVVPFAQGEGSRDRWVSEAGCGAATTPIDPSPCVEHAGCDGGRIVRFCAHDDAAFGGHGWPSWTAGAIWALFQASP